MNKIILVFMIMFLSGCGVSWFVNPKQQPVIEDKVGDAGKGYKVGTLATTPERRVVIVDLDDGKFCAEPPADAGENLASSFAAALEGTDGSIELKAELAKAFASSVKQLFQRSQGVQLYRDGMYSLCQAYLNGAILDDEFNKKQEELLKQSAYLIEKEIPYLQYINEKEEDPKLLVKPTLGDDG